MRPELTASPLTKKGHRGQTWACSMWDIISCQRRLNCSNWLTRSASRTSRRWCTGRGNADKPPKYGLADFPDLRQNKPRVSRPHHISAIGAVSTWGMPRRESRGGQVGLWGREEEQEEVIRTHLDCPENPNESCACNRSPYGTSLSGCPAMPRMPPIAETVVLGGAGRSG